MKAHNRLIEVVWEITDNCNQNCSYCGSKDIINKTPIDLSKIEIIADTICDYPPEEINISGGNPLLVPFNTHKYTVDQFKTKNIKTKILFNPFNIIDDESFDILALYDWKGVSINNEQELNEFRKHPDLFSSLTVVTNFNNANIFEFNKIEKFVLSQGFSWQIQYTMYKEINPLATYQNDASISYLSSLINSSKANIIKADNMNNGDCSAGKHSLGILANGDIIPCLSMRSWKERQDIKGNLLTTSLAGIWMEGFAIMRCNDFTCCKDITKVNEVVPVEKLLGNASLIKKLTDLVDQAPSYPVVPSANTIMLYGVSMRNNY